MALLYASEPARDALPFVNTTGTAMMTYLAVWLRLRIDHRAVTAMEYALIGGVIVATIFVGFSLLANSASTKFSSVGGKL
jgi:Flp pilus assembly pilin Flp